MSQLKKFKDKNNSEVKIIFRYANMVFTDFDKKGMKLYFLHTLGFSHSLIANMFNTTTPNICRQVNKCPVDEKNKIHSILNDLAKKYTTIGNISARLQLEMMDMIKND